MMDNMKNIRKANKIDLSWFSEYNIKHGLRNQNGTGVLVGITRISDVHGYKVEDGVKIPCDGSLFLRGIELTKFIEAARVEKRTGFEEMVYLLLTGNLPTKRELEDFSDEMNERKKLPKNFIEDILFKNTSKDIMNMMQRAVLAIYAYDINGDSCEFEKVFDQSLDLIAKIPAIMSYSYCAKKHYHDDHSLIIHPQITKGSMAENILTLLRGKDIPEEDIFLLDLLLMIHAEHGAGNNSAFATHVVSSTGTDTYSAIATAIGSLKGPKHGGANLKVLEMVEDIKKNCDYKNLDYLSDYIDELLAGKAFDEKGLVYGIGHAVYTNSDPRAEILREEAKTRTKGTEYEGDYELLKNIEDLTIKKIKNRKGEDFGICANVDLYSGLLYQILGFEKELYTPLFATARMVGWCAHRLEQITDPKIMRPGYVTLMKDQNYEKLKNR